MLAKNYRHFPRHFLIYNEDNQGVLQNIYTAKFYLILNGYRNDAETAIYQDLSITCRFMVNGIAVSVIPILQQVGTYKEKQQICHIKQ